MRGFVNLTNSRSKHCNRVSSAELPDLPNNILKVDHISSVRGQVFVRALQIAGAVGPFGRFRPITAVLARLGKQILRGTSATVTFFGGGKFTFSLSDPYWLKILMHGWHYEPEVESVFSVAGKLPDKVFVIDCGANIGYWAALNSQHQHFVTTVVEPSPTVLPQLELNLSFIEKNVTLRKNAIWHSCGEIVEFAVSDSMHAGSAVGEVSHHNLTAGDWRYVQAETITIDKICELDRPSDCALTIIKLDVEGAEVAAIEGAEEVLKRNDFLFLYEDHPTDRDSSITQKLLDLGLDIWSNGPGGLQKIHTIEDIAKAKSQSIWIYRFCNFLALRPGGSAQDLISKL